jgi:hypothetical protein
MAARVLGGHASEEPEDPEAEDVDDQQGPGRQRGPAAGEEPGERRLTRSLAPQGGVQPDAVGRRPEVGRRQGQPVEELPVVAVAGLDMQ